MTAYAYILLAMATFSLLAGVATDKQTLPDTMMGTAILLPLIGRVLGWW